MGMGQTLSREIHRQHCSCSINLASWSSPLPDSSAEDMEILLPRAVSPCPGFYAGDTGPPGVLHNLFSKLADP